jgi:hypothetical protein
MPSLFCPRFSREEPKKQKSQSSNATKAVPYPYPTIFGTPAMIRDPNFNTINGSIFGVLFEKLGSYLRKPAVLFISTGREPFNRDASHCSVIFSLILGYKTRFLWTHNKWCTSEFRGILPWNDPSLWVEIFCVRLNKRARLRLRSLPKC